MSMHGEQQGAVGGGQGTGADQTDQLIDATARAMTRGEPTPQLRGAIRGRIEQGRRSWAAPIWASALAGAAAIVLAVLIVWSHSTPGVAPPSPERIATAPQVPAPTVAVVTPSPGVGRDRERPEHMNASVPNAPNDSNDSNDPLIAPLLVEPLELPQIAVDTSSGVMPIEIEPLQIVPLQAQ